MKSGILCILVVAFLICACNNDGEEVKPTAPIEETPAKDSTASTPPPPSPDLSPYFPPVAEENWEIASPDSLNWDKNKLTELLDFLGNHNTYGFLVLHNGRIVAEKYWNDWSKETAAPIASAGKSITAVLTGLARQRGLLNLNDPTSKFLGEGWSMLDRAAEDAIQLRHHLSMTTGLDENETCISKECFRYKSDAGARWAYHTQAYQMLHRVLEKAMDKDIDQITKEMLADHIGLRNWKWEDDILSLTTRDMARFGWFALNKGAWNGTRILSDSLFFQSMVSSSSDLNKSYGYLWWLNGKSSHLIPFENEVKSGSLISTAPNDMFAAMGKGDKKIYVVPSRKLVVVRHGDDTGVPTYGPSSFDTELWRRLMPVLDKQN